MKNRNSLKAFHKEENKERRKSIKSKIKELFRDRDVFLTARETATRLGLNKESTRKRMSDLEKEGFLEVYGSKQENGNDNSIYTKSSNQLSIPMKRKSRLDIFKEIAKNRLSSDDFAMLENEFKERLR